MKRVVLGVAVLVAGVSGCASPAKDVSFDPATGSGVVSIPANTDVWPTYNRSQAISLIQSRLGPNFEIVEEREVVTGQTTSNNRQINTEQTVNSQIPVLPAEKQTITDTSTTRDVTEYRIAYRKRSTPATPGGDVVQTQYQSGSGGVQQAGGLVPSVAPGPIVRPAGGLTGKGCPDGKCYNR